MKTSWESRHCSRYAEKKKSPSKSIISALKHQSNERGKIITDILPDMELRLQAVEKAVKEIMAAGFFAKP
jgi:nucleoside-triphosphatase THEP1